MQPGGKAVVTLRLGIRKGIKNSKEKHWMSVDFWDTQVRVHLPPEGQLPFLPVVNLNPNPVGFTPSMALSRLWSSNNAGSHRHFFIEHVIRISCMTQAFQVAQYVQKGSQIAIGGRLQHDEWTNDAGEPQSRTKVPKPFALKATDACRLPL